MPQLISDDAMTYLHIALNIVARLIISVVGVVTNLINMIIFTKLGLKDSMTVGLFSLSLTDFLVTGLQLASCLSYVIDLLCVNTGLDARYLGYFTLGWSISALYEVSCWITAMVSLERCYCVVSPFKVKQVFTRYRCVVVTFTIYFIHIGVHIPVYVVTRMTLVEDVSLVGNNMTTWPPESVSTTILNPELSLIEFLLDITAGVSVWLFSQAIIIVCAVWMGYSLEASSKIRYKSRNHRQTGQHSSSLSNRERRLVNVVLVLAITLTCCNIPKMLAATIVYLVFPDANTDKQEHIGTVLWALAYIFGTLGCSVSFVVYLKLNANYRREFDYIFRRSKTTSITTTGKAITNTNTSNNKLSTL